MNDYMNLGRVVPLHRGDYDAAQTYELNDIVNYQGAGYWHRGSHRRHGMGQDHQRRAGADGQPGNAGGQ